jgi:hypothetical protein
MKRHAKKSSSIRQKRVEAQLESPVDDAEKSISKNAKSIKEIAWPVHKRSSPSSKKK